MATDRKERVAAGRRIPRRRTRTENVLIIGALGVALLGALGLGVLAVRDAMSDDAGADALAAVAIPGVSMFAHEAGHVPGEVTYAQTPPAGGDHNPEWLNCGTYTAPVSNEKAVHSLEHGAVWVTYRPDLPIADVRSLLDLVPLSYTLISPYPELPAPVVVSAWGRQLMLEGPNDPRLMDFVRLYVQGAQAPEPGAPCSGGADR